MLEYYWALTTVSLILGLLLIYVERERYKLDGGLYANSATWVVGSFIPFLQLALMLIGVFGLIVNFLVWRISVK